MGTGGIKRPEPGVDCIHHPALRLKKEYSSNTCSVEIAGSCSTRDRALYDDVSRNSRTEALAKYKTPNKRV
jgi:hypothetical protein